MDMFSAVLAADSNSVLGGGGEPENTPIDYGGNLKLFMDAENGVTLDGIQATDWLDQGQSGKTFSVPSSSRSPEFESSTQNGLPGLNFQQPVESLFLNRKLSDPLNDLDNMFHGSGTKSIAFAGRLNRISDTKFGVNSTIVSKGHVDSGGWDLSITANGTMLFRQRRSNNSVWQLSANGFYSAGDLVLGYLNYDGGNSSGSGFFRLYNGSEFVTVGSASLGSASGIGSDSSKEMILGNVRNTSNSDSNAPFEGPLFGVWITTPARNQFDEAYLARWIS